MADPIIDPATGTPAATGDSATPQTPESPSAPAAAPDSATGTPAVPAPQDVPKSIEELKTQRRKRQEAEKEAAYWRGVAEGRVRADGQPATPSTPASVPTPPVKPDPNQYGDDYAAFIEAKDKWVADLTKYEAARQVEEAKKEVQRDFETQRQQQTMEQKVTQFKARIEAASESDPDLLDIVKDPSIPWTDPMRQVLFNSPEAPKLVRYLNDNRGVFAQIASMDPISAARELGLLEAKMTGPTTPTQKISQAPAPITPVGTGVSPAITDVEDLPMSEYVARMNAIDPSLPRQRARGR
jgi:hypothetical protein